MRERIFMKGIVLSAHPAGEHDKRLTIFTNQAGKITAFAHGARRPNSSLVAATNPFCFGTFTLIEGKSAYSLVEAKIDNYFEELRADLDAAYYGMFFLELTDYYTRENNEDLPLLNLLYVSLRALCTRKMPLELIRCVFELRALMTEGEYPGVTKEDVLSSSARYTLSFIEETPLERLYSFTVSEEVLTELDGFCAHLRNRFIDRPMKSLQMLQTL